MLRIIGKERMNQGSRRKPREYGLSKASEESVCKGKELPN